MSRIRLLLGIGIFWLSLGMLYQGIGELVLPSYLLHVPGFGATTLGLITFVGLLAGISVQPLAGALSDQLRARWGRMPIIVAGVGLVLIATLSLASVQTWEGIFFSYVLVHVAAGIAQAGQQALLPDRLPARQRGTGAGIQAFMAFGGLMLGIALLGHVASRGGVNRALLVVGATLVGTLGLSMALLREGSQWAPNRGWIDLWKAIRVAVRLGGQDAYRLDITRHKEFTRLVAARFLFLLGVFAVQRSLLPFVANRLALDPAQATTQSNTLPGGPCPDRSHLFAGGWLGSRPPGARAANDRWRRDSSLRNHPADPDPPLLANAGMRGAVGLRAGGLYLRELGTHSGYRAQRTGRSFYGPGQLGNSRSSGLRGVVWPAHRRR
jgi:MFS family permease